MSICRNIAFGLRAAERGRTPFIQTAPLYCKHPKLDPSRHPHLYRQAAAVERIAKFPGAHILYHGPLAEDLSILRLSIGSVSVSFSLKDCDILIQPAAKKSIEQAASQLLKHAKDGLCPKESIVASSPVALSHYLVSNNPKGIALAGDLSAAEPLAKALDVGFFSPEWLEICDLLKIEPFTVPSDDPPPEIAELSQKTQKTALKHFFKNPNAITWGIIHLISKSKIIN